MCNAANHSYGCRCGFGGEGSLGGGNIGISRSPNTALPRGLLRNYSLSDLAIKLGRSLTIPTVCRYCEADIFLFASPTGGFAVFDHLGIPWPKHGCWGSQMHRDWTINLEESRHCDFKIPVPSGVIYYPYQLSDGSYVSGTIIWVKNVNHPRGIKPLIELDLLDVDGKLVYRFNSLVELGVGSCIYAQVASVRDVGICLVNIEVAEYPGVIVGEEGNGGNSFVERDRTARILGGVWR